MTNNNISSQGRLCVDCVCANLHLWFVVHIFLLKQLLLGYKHYIVKQCLINDFRAIVYQKDLALTDPEYFTYLVNFASKYDIYLQEDRRARNIYVDNERRKPSALLTIISILLISGAAFAGNKTSDQQVIDQSKQQPELAELLSWVRFKMSQLEFEVGYELPNIQRLPRSQMFKLAFGNKINRIASSQSAASVYGLYNYQNETIYLLDSIDITTTKGKAILLHELVHYLQYKNGHNSKVECQNRLEYLAYYLEAAYLKEHGEEIGFSQDHVRRVVQCNT